MARTRLTSSFVTGLIFVALAGGVGVAACSDVTEPRLPQPSEEPEDRDTTAPPGQS